MGEEAAASLTAGHSPAPILQNRANLELFIKSSYFSVIHKIEQNQKSMSPLVPHAYEYRYQYSCPSTVQYCTMYMVLTAMVLT